MQDTRKEMERLLQTLHEKLSELLCAEDVSEVEKVARIERATALFKDVEV
jgi:hypothetical protein